VFKTTQNDDLIAAALLKHMGRAASGRWVGFSDPYGDNWLGLQRARETSAPRSSPSNATVVPIERHRQTLKLIVAKPDAMLIAAVGGLAVLPQTALRDQGFKGTIYQTHAVATDDFIKLGKDKVEGTVLAAGPMLAIDEISDGIRRAGWRSPHRRIRKAAARNPRRSVRTRGTPDCCSSVRFPSR
jgi:branched-chain amino acid transport system substrate-binding protein